MIKRVAFTAIVLAVAGVAFAKAQKLAVTAVFNESPSANGHVILNYARGADKTIFNLHLRNFTPDTFYIVEILPAGVYGGVQTDEYGNLVHHEQIPFEVVGTTINIYTQTNPPELRAVLQ